jgi:ABC-2 type transport system permease protein
MIVVFGDNFPDNIGKGTASVQLLVDATNPNQATMLTGYASNIIAAAVREITPKTNATANAAWEITPNIKMLYNPEMKGAYNFVPGVLGVILMLICAMMTSVSIVREKETGTMEVLLVSPLKPVYIVVAKVIPYFILSVVNMTTVLLLSVFLLKVPVSGNMLTLIGFTVLFIVVALALGVLISTLVHTQATALLISGMVLMMPSMVLSGMIFPLDSMPKILQWFSDIFPVRWYIEGIRKIMIQGVGWHYVIREFMILAGMAAVILSVSIKKFNIRLM